MFEKSQSHTAAVIDEQRFEALLNDIVKRRKEIQDQRFVSHDIVAELKALGLYNSFVPECFGGTGMHPSDFMRYIERISAADGSVGWVASFCFATKYLSSLPVKTLEVIYADGPDVVFAGAVFPPQTAIKVEGGVRVTGRWGFGSGCMGADVIGVGIKVEDGEKSQLPLMAVLPADKVKIDPVWNTIGMTGTGSHDLVVEDVFVPDDWILVRGGPPSIDTPAYRYPALAMAAQVLAVCGLGVARAAIDHVVGVAGKSKSITGAPSLGDRANVQIHLGECEAKLRAAQCWFYERTDAAWKQILAGKELDRTLNMELRLASSHAAKTSADVARACFEMTGTMGIFNENPLSRYLTDALVTAQHAFLAEGTFMNAGKVMVGQPFMHGFD
ncbi:acyl-CoA dehydrogenase family protein [Kordiimonas pumila]|uniref:Acyl-CoA dehydrogenase family protein n=1 Tax=Kordiimonas pumila TaxID=2161677 RepID=A0ABV7D4M9_9PROT|nr:acyl-CoA dehydrogenase family protein [Kordiimonas pumila]